MPDSIILTRLDLMRICGFIGCDKTEFAQKLGVTKSYLSRLLCGKNAITANISTKALVLLEQYVLTRPSDFLTLKIGWHVLTQLQGKSENDFRFLMQQLRQAELEHNRQLSKESI